MRPWNDRGRVRVDAAPPDGRPGRRRGVAVRTAGGDAVDSARRPEHVAAADATSWDSDARAVVDAACDVLSGGISRPR